MAKKSRHVSETPATQLLRRSGVGFTDHVYDYVEHGGTAESARQLGVDEHAVVKTLVMQDETARPLIVLMHGDRTGEHQEPGAGDRRQVGRALRPRGGRAASGYQVGGTSPFGIRKPMPVYVEETVLGLDRIYINGGRRGFLVGIEPRVLIKSLGARPVRCANHPPESTHTGPSRSSR